MFNGGGIFNSLTTNFFVFNDISALNVQTNYKTNLSIYFYIIISRKVFILLQKTVQHIH